MILGIHLKTKTIVSDKKKLQIFRLFFQLCFAYKGALLNQVGVVVTYFTKNEENALESHETSRYLTFTDEIIQATEWRHICLDLNTKLSSG